MSEKICEICKNIIEENEETTSCPDCGREFHSKCWRMTGCCIDPECRQKATERKDAERKKKQEAIEAEKAKAEAETRKCPKCGKILNPEEEFCGKCGAKLGEEVKKETAEKICRNCGRKMNPEEEFCCKCGTAYTVPKTIEPIKIKKSIDKSSVKKIAFIATAVLCVVITTVIILQATVKPFTKPCTIHKYETVEEIKKATCTEGGTEKWKCSVCGKTKTVDTYPNGHDWTVTNTKGATCTEDGYEEHKCIICGATEKETIPAGHDWSEATCREPSKCHMCGKTQGKKLDHEYSQCKCIYCGQEVPMVTYKGIQLPQMPFTENGVAFLSVDGLTVNEDIQIRIKNNGIDYEGYSAKEIYYKLYAADGTVLTSNWTYVHNIGYGETTIIQLSLYNTNYSVKKVLISTVPFD